MFFFVCICFICYVTYRLLNNIYIALLFIFFFIYLSYHLLNNTYIALLLIFLFAYHTVYLIILTLSCSYLHCFFSLLSTYRTVFWIIPTSFFYLISPLSNKLSYGCLNNFHDNRLLSWYFPPLFPQLSTFPCFALRRFSISPISRWKGRKKTHNVSTVKKTVR